MPRPHFRPAANWMNDPNGLVFHDGRYHLFFQYNPHGTGHANMSWGHASSPDLLRWTEHGVAIPCDEEEDVFSGSVVVDEENTSGFGTDGRAPLVAIYTSAYRNAPKQAQSLAYSLDGGMTWTRHAGNPVLDRDSSDFRDPKVFRWTGDGAAYWVMVAVEARQQQVLLYRSDDLRSWEQLSTFGPAGAVGGVWECPDLFPLAVDGDPDDVRWVMLVSLYPGGIAGGSGTQYFVGSFDGVEFVPDVAAPPVQDPRESVSRWLDRGRDDYAGVTFAGLPDRDRTLIAWMSNWDYAREVPARPSRGAMTTARRLSLVSGDDGPVLRQEPVLPELVWTTVDGLEAELPETAVVDATLRLGEDGGALLRLRHDGSGDGGVVVGVERGVLTVDRREASDGAHPGLASVETAPIAVDEPVRLRILVEPTSIEVYADEGRTVVTSLAFTAEDANALTVEPRGTARVESLRVGTPAPRPAG